MYVKVSNAYAEEGDTGDLAFREHADDNRASFRRTVGSRWQHASCHPFPFRISDAQYCEMVGRKVWP